MHSGLVLLAAAIGTAAAMPNNLAERQSGFSTDSNADCGFQPFGYGPPSVPPTDSGFSSFPVYQYSSLLAPAPTNYTASFRNATGSSQQAGYMGYYLLEIYNTTQCAGYCNSANGCKAFNIYYERDPIQKPADSCPNPFPTTNIKCAIYNQPLSGSTATNQGQYRQQFHVVIAGSDGFNHN